MMTHRNLAREGMTLPLDEALRLEDDKGKPLKFEIDERFANDPTSGALPSYYYEDYEAKKVYTLSIESLYNLVTLRVGDMTEEQINQNQSSKTSKAKVK